MRAEPVTAEVLADTFGKAYLPSLALFLIYLAMILVLMFKPYGLLGKN